MFKKINTVCLLFLIILLASQGVCAEGNVSSFPGNPTYTTDAFYYSDQYLWKVSLYVAKSSDTKNEQTKDGSINQDNFYDHYYPIGNVPLYLIPETKGNGTPWHAGKRPSQISETYLSQSPSKLKTMTDYQKGGIGAVSDVTFKTWGETTLLRIPNLPYVPNLSDGDVYNNGVIIPETVGDIEKVKAYFNNPDTVNKILDAYATKAGTTRAGLVQNLTFTIEGETKDNWNPITILPGEMNGNAVNCVGWLLVYEPVTIVYVEDVLHPETSWKNKDGSYFGYAMTATDFSVTQLKKQMDWSYDESRWSAWSGHQPDAFKPNGERQHVQRLSNLLLGNATYLQNSWFGLPVADGVNQDAAIPNNRWKNPEQLRAGGYAMTQITTPHTFTKPSSFEFRPDTDVILTCPIYTNTNEKSQLQAWGKPQPITVTYTFNYNVSGEAKTDILTDVLESPCSYVTQSFVKWHTPNYEEITELVCKVSVTPYPSGTVNNGKEDADINIRIVPLEETVPPDPKVDDKMSDFSDLDPNFTLPEHKEDGADNVPDEAIVKPKVENINGLTPEPIYLDEHVIYEITTNSVTQTLKFKAGDAKTIQLTPEKVGESILKACSQNESNGQITWRLEFIPTKIGTNTYELTPSNNNSGDGEKASFTVEVEEDPDIPIIYQILIHPIKSIYTLYTEVKNIPLEYAVYFKTNNDQKIDPQTIKYGEKVGNPGVLTQDGYIFKGWYKDSGFSELWDFNEGVVTSVMTLYAKWNVETFTITFDPMGGSIETNTVIAEHGESIAEPTNPTREHYKFSGWFKDINCLDPYNFEVDTIKEDITLYAKWLPDFYKIEFNAMGGNPVDPIQASYDSIVAEPNQPEKLGFSFDGWYKDEGTTIPYNWSSDRVNGNFTLYAKWVADIYTVTFDSMDGSAIDPQEISSLKLVIKPIDPTREGFDFKGWFKENTTETPWSFTEDKVTRNIVLYAKWEANQITFHFNTNGGIEVADYKGLTDQLILQRQMPITSRTGYSFMGWFLTEDFSGEASIELPERFPENSQTYHAKWEINTYMVVFKENGGNPVVNQEVIFNEKAARPTPEITRTGYAFDGWFRESTFETEWNFDHDVVVEYTNLFAKWNINSYTISFDSNGGDAVDPVTQEFETTLKEPESARYGYTLLGWYKDEACTEIWNFNSDVITKSQTLYAKWEETTYALTDFFEDRNLAEEVRLEINTHIDRQGTPIQTIDQKVVRRADLDQTTKLIIGNGPIILTLNGIHELKNIETLTITGREITTIPQEIDQLTKVTKINLSDNLINELPIEFFNLTTLTELNLSENELKNISSLVNKLKNVEKLNLSTNKLTGIPNTFWDMTSLKCLNISHNSLNTLSLDIGNLTELIELYINDIDLEVLPHSIGVLSKIKILEASNNTIIKIPQTFRMLEEMVYFDISQNNIEKLSKEVLGGIKKIETLNLANNKISEIPSNIKDRDTLRTFNCNANPDLKYLPLSMGEMNQLTYLTVVATSIEQYPMAMEHLSGLTVNPILPYGYTIHCNTQGGNTLSDFQADYQTTISKPDDPERSGYTFEKWYKEAEAIHIWNFSIHLVEGETTLYANWIANPSTFFFESNNGTPIDSIKGETDAKVTDRSLPDTTRSGYTFKGWHENEDLSGTAISLLPERFPIKSQTFYAKWEANPSTIYFEGNGGSAVTNLVGVTDQIITNRVMPEISRSGYTFKGWFDNDGLNGKTITQLPDKYPIERITYWAKWEANPSIINFETNGGSAVESIVGVTDQTITNRTMPEITRSEFVFGGWFNNPDLSGDKITQLPTSYPVNGATYYARWHPAICKVDFDANGGSPDSLQNINYGETITTPEIPGRYSYNFTGWYTDISATNEFDQSTPIYDHTRLYAGWVFNRKTTSFDLPEKTNATQTHTITLDNLHEIEQIYSDKGNVSVVSINGDNATVEVSNGNSHRSEVVSGTYTPSSSRTETDSRSSQGSNTTPSSVSYNSGGYSGTLGKTGTTNNTVQTGGSYTPAQSATKSTSRTTQGSDTTPSRVYYNSGGYSGYLNKGDTTTNKVQTGGTYTPADSKRVTQNKTFTVKCYKKWDGSEWVYGGDVGFITTISYNSGGYIGQLSLGKKVSQGEDTLNFNYPSNPSVGQRHMYRILSDLTYEYSGTVTKPASDTRTYRTDYTASYSGTVTKPASDTRTYRTDYTSSYSGTVTKPAVDTRVYAYYYKYKITVDYIRK